MATIYWRGRSAYLNWHDSTGQQRISLGQITPRDAEKIRAAKQYELATGQQLLVTFGVPLFRDFAKEYMQWFEAEYPSSSGRAESVIVHLVDQFGYTALDQIKPQAVNQWKASQKADSKAETVNKRLRTLKAMLNRAVEWEVIKANPIDAVKGAPNLDSKPPLFYTVDELNKLYQADRGDIWRLFANTGMRRGEGINLRREHIKGGRVRILSETGARTKSAKWREVPLNNAAGEALERLPGADYVLPRMTPESYSRAFLRDARSARLKGNLHCLRHTFCSHLVMLGKPLRTVQVLAGHSSITVTERYAHLAPGYLANSLEGFDL